MPDAYSAPAHILAAAKAALLPNHPAIGDEWLHERATVVAAFAEAANLRRVPEDHPVYPSIVDGAVPGGVVLPPPPGLCAHCGTAVPDDQHYSDYTVEGTTLTVSVTHCPGCHQNDACMTRCAPKGA